MSGICGWLGYADLEEHNQRILNDMIHELTRYDLTKPSWQLQLNSALAVSANTEQTSIYSGNGLLATVWGDARFEKAALASRAAVDGFARTLAEEYLQQGAAILQQVRGSFALAIVSESRQKALLAIDRTGTRSLAYTQQGNSLLFSSNLRALARHPVCPKALNPQAIYDYLYFHMIPAPLTIYLDVHRLLPGEALELNGHELRRFQHWQPEFKEPAQVDFADSKTQFLALLRESVRQLSEGSNTGAFLSGGTDSSTIAGVLTEVSGKPAATYSIGFDAQGYDEMEFARIAAKRFGTKHTEYYVTPDDVAKAMPMVAQIADQPFGNSSAVPGYYCAKLAREDGIERMLGGDGGDELFGGNARYAKQHVFDIYDNIPKGIRKALIEPIAFGLPGGNHIGLVRKARSYIQQANVGMPARLETYNLLERFGANRVFTEAFLAAVDTNQPLVLLSGVYNGAKADSMINRMLALDFKFTLADNDLVKVNLACELAGTSAHYPLLNDKLLDFSLALPADYKLKGGRKLRWFFKEALRGFLPDEIITKEKHGFGLPFGPWLQQHAGLQTLVSSSLQSLKSRNIIRAEFIDEVMSVIKTHPGYYGTMVWILVMLELWLEQHQ